MQVVVKPGHMRGVVTPPPSKSMMQRVCALALLYPGKTVIHNPGQSEDDKAALDIIQQLGATISYSPDNSIVITSSGLQPASNNIHCGESGLSARLFIPIAAMCDNEMTITGAGSLMKRPMTEYVNVLPQLHASVIASNDCLPMIVKGPLQPANITVDGSLSSQFLSGLLIAYAFATLKPVIIQVTNLKSKPYIDLTLELLKRFDIEVVNQNYEAFTILPPVFSFDRLTIADIESDWSAAANFVVAQAMAADIVINGLNSNSVQADRAISSVVNNKQQPFNFDATDCPDLIPILSVYAGYCRGESRIIGLHRLEHKESNRIASTTAMLTQLGVSYTIEGDVLVIEGGQSFKGCTVDGYNDHRIVMAAAIAALNADGPVTITDADAVNKSYPAFFETLSSLGVDCQLVN